MTPTACGESLLKNGSAPSGRTLRSGDVCGDTVVRFGTFFFSDPIAGWPRFDVRPVRWPLRRPFVTALGQKSHSDNILVRVRLTDGTEGWGEASSSSGHAVANGARSGGRAPSRWPIGFAGRDVRDIEPLVRDVWALRRERKRSHRRRGVRVGFVGRVGRPRKDAVV
jgi:hypothetical protein